MSREFAPQLASIDTRLKLGNPRLSVLEKASEMEFTRLTQEPVSLLPTEIAPKSLKQKFLDIASNVGGRLTRLGIAVGEIGPNVALAMHYLTQVATPASAYAETINTPDDFSNSTNTEAVVPASDTTELADLGLSLDNAVGSDGDDPDKEVVLPEVAGVTEPPIDEPETETIKDVLADVNADSEVLPDGTLVAQIDTTTPPEATPVPETPKRILAQDNFDSYDKGIFGADATRRYIDGEYEIKNLKADTNSWATTAKQFTDSVVSVDVRLIQSQNGQGAVGCHINKDGSGILASFNPDLRSYSLDLTDGSKQLTNLARGNNFAILTGNQINHISLACIGSDITLEINNTPIAKASDSTYPSGSAEMRIAREATGRFDNFVVTDK